MAKKELKKVFNLNTYEWWRNHRRVVTFGLFLSIFAFYLGNPFYKEAKVKDTCAKLNSNYQITGDEAMKNLNLKEIKNYNNRELANYYCERYLGIKWEKCSAYYLHKKDSQSFYFLKYGQIIHKCCLNCQGKLGRNK